MVKVSRDNHSRTLDERTLLMQLGYVLVSLSVRREIIYNWPTRMRRVSGWKMNLVARICRWLVRPVPPRNLLEGK